MQVELNQASKLLHPSGDLIQVGWARQPILDCNLEAAHFYPGRVLQRLRIKRWDYYAVFTPRLFFSATIADLGYAGNIFVYILDLSSGELHEEGLVIPFSMAISLPRNSTQGESHFGDQRAQLNFKHEKDLRHISVEWPGFNQGLGIKAQLSLLTTPDHESMNIVIPIGVKRFYYNNKINCLPAEGIIKYGDLKEELSPGESLGSLDWGRGVWEYNSFWNWASSSGFLPDGRTIGLNLGGGFGDTSRATENCIVLDGRIHKLAEVNFLYNAEDYYSPWEFSDSEGRMKLQFVPFKERKAVANLLLIFSEVHQMFGRYSGWVKTDLGERIEINDLIGFAEEHYARW